MRLLIHIGLMLVISTELLSQEVTLSQSVDKTVVAVGEQFQLTITLSGEMGAITPPDLADFSVLTGPIINVNPSIGKGHIDIHYSEAYILSAKKIGKLTIGPAKAQTFNGLLTAESIVMEVSQHSEAPDPDALQGDSLVLEMPKGYALMAIPSKKEVVVGEPLMISYVLFANKDKINFEKLHGPLPKHQGFVAEGSFRNNAKWSIDPSRRFKKALLADQILTPMEAGTFELSPWEKVVTYQGGFFSFQEFIASSSPVTITVKPLPSGASSDFIGAIGRYNLSAQLSDTLVETNEALHLKIQIKGSGNINSLVLPEIEDGNGLEVYPPEITDNIKNVNGDYRGTRTFDYLIIARRPGIHPILPVSFEYYDPLAKRYRIVSSPSYTLRAEGAGSAADISGIPDLDSKSVDPENTRAAMRRAVSLDSARDGFAGSGFHWGLFLLPFLILATYLTFQKKKRSSEENIRSTELRAERIARKYLSEAERHLSSGDDHAFYASLNSAMDTYLSKKLNIATVEMSSEHIYEALESKGLDGKTLEQWMLAQRQCQAGTYGARSVSRPQELYNEVASLIQSLESLL